MNRSILKGTAIAILGLALSACGGGLKSGATVKPDWLENPSKTYPDASYLTGTGSFRYLRSAKDAATDAITTKFRFIAAPGLPAYLGSAAMQRDSKPLLEAITGKIQIVDTWYDDTNAQYHAFAIIPKGYAGDQIKKLIAALDETTREQIERTGTTPDRLQKIAHAGKALQAQVLREFYTKLLHDIDVSGNEVRLVWQTARLQDDFEKLLHRILIKPLILNDDLGVLKTALVASLQASNFGVETTAQPDYLLESTLTLKSKEKQNGKTRVSAELNIYLLDTDRKIHGKQSWPLTFIAAEDLKASAVAACRELLDRELLPAIMDFATGN